MSQHPNARLTPRGRETLVSRIGSGVGVAEGASARGSSAGMRCTETRAVQLQSSAAASTRAAIFLYMI